jgi:hypothetical protein
MKNLHQTIDGSCTMSAQQLIVLIKKAYKKTALIPSRGVWGYNKYYASASGALLKAFGEFPQVSNKDWLDGFDVGFEHSDIPTPTGMHCNVNVDNESSQFKEGFNFGKIVAKEIFFNWPDSPTIHSVPEN